MVVGDVEVVAVVVGVVVALVVSHCVSPCTTLATNCPHADKSRADMRIAALAFASQLVRQLPPPLPKERRA